MKIHSAVDNIFYASTDESGYTTERLKSTKKNMEPIRRELTEQGYDKTHPMHAIIGYGWGPKDFIPDADHVVIARDPQGKIAGALSHNVFRSEKWLQLKSMRTLPEHKGKGVGEKMVKEMAAHTKELPNGHKYNMFVNGAVPTAIPFYQKMGADFPNPESQSGEWPVEKTQQLANGIRPEPGYVADRSQRKFNPLELINHDEERVSYVYSDLSPVTQDAISRAENDWDTKRQYLTEGTSAPHINNPQFDINGARKFVNDVTDKEGLTYLPVHEHKEDPNISGIGKTPGGAHVMMLSEKHMNPSTILHELTHYKRTVKNGTEEADLDHGPQFNYDYLQMLKAHHPDPNAARVHQRATDYVVKHMTENPEKYPPRPQESDRYRSSSLREMAEAMTVRKSSTSKRSIEDKSPDNPPTSDFAMDPQKKQPDIPDPEDVDSVGTVGSRLTYKPFLNVFGQ